MSTDIQETFDQLAHMLRLTSNAGLDLKQIKSLHSMGHFHAFLQAAKEGRLPPYTQFVAALANSVAIPVEERTINVVPLHLITRELGGAGWKLGDQIYRYLEQQLKESQPEISGDLSFKTVTASPLRLGADRWVLDNLDGRNGSHYLFRCARERKHRPFKLLQVLSFCLNGSQDRERILYACEYGSDKFLVAAWNTKMIQIYPHVAHDAPVMFEVDE